MAENYVHTKIHLTDSQRKQIAKALEAGSGVSLKFTYSQLQKDDNYEILLTKTQHSRLEKKYKEGKGTTLKISLRQLNAMKTGGFLPQLLVGVASALAPMLFSKLFDNSSSQGSGILLPGSEEGNGILLPGGGTIDGDYVNYQNMNDRDIPGDNGGRLGYSVDGSKTSYLPDSAMNLSNVQNPKAAGLDKKKPQKKRVQNQKAQTGMGTYLDPMSEKFQMLQ